MNPRDCFILGLRFFGIWQLIETIEYFFTAFGVSVGSYSPSATSASWYTLATFVHFFLAVWLLKFAPATARFFYPDRASSNSPAVEQPPATPTI